ncbi:MAG TPA: aldo/keto reductase [Polyangiaceae bacterium]|nr:aldo/keto reductase [Polyangiaceae bacterium]
MRERSLGSSGLRSSELCLGTWGLSGEAYGPVSEEEARAVLERAVALGITSFETASSYARGKVESWLGEVLAAQPGALVFTKWGTDREPRPPRKDFGRDFLARTADASLERLGSGARVVALLHNPSLRALQAGEATGYLEELRAAGRIASWGVSAGSLEVAQASLDAGAPLLSISYNLLEVGLLRALSRRLETEGQGLLVHSVLAYGLLTGRWTHGQTFGFGDHRAERWPGSTLRARLRHLDALRPLVSGEVPSLRAAALRFALTPDVVSAAVIGPHSTAQLDQLVRDAQPERPYFPEQKLSGLEGRLSHLGIPR